MSAHHEIARVNLKISALSSSCQRMHVIGRNVKKRHFLAFYRTSNSRLRPCEVAAGIVCVVDRYKPVIVLSTLQ